MSNRRFQATAPEASSRQIVGAQEVLALSKDFDVIEGFQPREGAIYNTTRAISSRVNQNFDGFSAAELKKAYRSFLGKPCFVNHENSDPSVRRGRVVGSRFVENGTDKYIEVIQEVYADKYPKLAKEIVEGGLDSVSMGCEAKIAECSLCGNLSTGFNDMCDHIKFFKGHYLPRVNEKTGKTEEVLIYENCKDLGFFELSYVFEPADETAVVSNVIVASKKQAYGEVEAPAKVDTLRQENDSDFDDYHHWVESPEEFQTPDFDQTKRIDRETEDDQDEGDSTAVDGLEELDQGIDEDDPFADEDDFKENPSMSRVQSKRRVAYDAPSDQAVDALNSILGGSGWQVMEGEDENNMIAYQDWNWEKGEYQFMGALGGLYQGDQLIFSFNENDDSELIAAAEKAAGMVTAKRKRASEGWEEEYDGPDKFWYKNYGPRGWWGGVDDQAGPSGHEWTLNGPSGNIEDSGTAPSKEEAQRACDESASRKKTSSKTTAKVLTLPGKYIGYICTSKMKQPIERTFKSKTAARGFVRKMAREIVGDRGGEFSYEHSPEYAVRGTEFLKPFQETKNSSVKEAEDFFFGDFPVEAGDKDYLLNKMQQKRYKIFPEFVAIPNPTQPEERGIWSLIEEPVVNGSNRVFISYGHPGSQPGQDPKISRRGWYAMVGDQVVTEGKFHIEDTFYEIKHVLERVNGYQSSVKGTKVTRARRKQSDARDPDYVSDMLFALTSDAGAEYPQSPEEAIQFLREEMEEGDRNAPMLQDAMQLIQTQGLPENRENFPDDIQFMRPTPPREGSSDFGVEDESQSDWGDSSSGWGSQEDVAPIETVSPDEDFFETPEVTETLDTPDLPESPEITEPTDDFPDDQKQSRRRRAGGAEKYEVGDKVFIDLLGLSGYVSEKDSLGYYVKDMSGEEYFVEDSELSPMDPSDDDDEYYSSRKKTSRRK